MDLFHVFYYNECVEIEKRKKMFVLFLLLVLVGIIVFVLISNRAEAPTEEKSSVQFRGPVGEPNVKGPTTPIPVIRN